MKRRKKKEEVYRANQLTPKKRELSPWAFSTRQEGELHRFKFPNTESAIERMKEHLNNQNRWKRYPGPHPENFGGSRMYTLCTIIPEYDILKIFCLYFPDGTVWDSSLRSFRQIKDYEQINKA